MVATIHIPVLVIPGADISLITATGLLHGRRLAVITVLGIISGAAVMVVAAIILMQATTSIDAQLVRNLKIFGALYLVFMAFTMLRDQNPAKDRRNQSKLFWLGLLTEITNPRTILFFIVVFSMIAKSSPTNIGYHLVAGGTILFLTAVCYLGLAIASSTSRLRTVLTRRERIIKVIACFALLVVAGLSLLS